MQNTFSGKRILSGLALGAMMIASTTAAFADNEVNERQRDQQARIAQGVANGSMTARETAKVEGQGELGGAFLRRQGLRSGGVTVGLEPRHPAGLCLIGVDRRIVIGPAAGVGDVVHAAA